jgi:hypothetical protein
MKCSKPKIAVLIAGLFVLGGTMLLLFGGILSTPRDFSSPGTTIRLVDEKGYPMSGIEVGRAWYDGDLNVDGHDVGLTDKTGVCLFSKVPANVGLFTGTLRKTGSFFVPCGSGSGTYTTIYVRYHGIYKVVPKGKTLHSVGMSNQDPDGVWFDASTDALSNTLANLTFPMKAKTIDYILSASPNGP